MAKSKAIITITAGAGGSVNISTVFEPTLTREMTGSDHPAAQVALEMVAAWRRSAAADGSIDDDQVETEVE